MLPICHVSAFCRRISFTNVRWCIVGALRRRYFPMGEITGRMISVELWCDRPRRSLDFDSLRGAPPLHGCTASYMVRFLQQPMVFEFVGEDIIFPVVSPMGKQHRRNAPTMAVTNILRCIFVVLYPNMVYLATSEPLYGQNGSAQKFATLAGGYYPPLHGVCH